MESYLKYTFSRSILIFAMAWMGTRDIYTALFITLVFDVCANYLFNEESPYCCLPESFTSYHENLEMPSAPTQDQINQAIKVLADVKQNSGGQPEPTANSIPTV
jgi:hypothetical protein